VADGFRTWAGPAADDAFEALLASARFEELGRGRRGTVLVQVDAEGAVPLVRTTTSYRAPAQRYGDIHVRLAEEIRRGGALACAFNNLLIEHYTAAYATMKRHSDQALDLADGSSIAIYSCYRDPRHPSRRLVVTPKEPGGEPFEIPLEHGRVVAFSLETNRRFTHTIALDRRVPENDWLGVTFRTSKTLVRFVDGQPRLADGAPLTLATEKERRDFFQLRRRENDETAFEYPPIAYTISESDLQRP
jgi:hypothetical protein